MPAAEPTFSLLPISAQTFVGILTCVVMIHLILGTIPLLIYFERKISAYIQDRLGPNRVGFDLGLPLLQKLFRGFGFWGLGQSLADGLKFVLKEDYMPRGADRWLFTLAPMAAVVPAFIGWAVVPWGGSVDFPGLTLFGTEVVAAGRALVSVADINVGFVYLVAIASLGIYGVTLGGWASNNKYSFLGGMRASAGMISYEIPLGLAILATLLVAGSFKPSEIVAAQAGAGGVWFALAQPLAAVLSSPASSPRPTAPRSTTPRPSRSSSAATTPSTRRCASRSSSSPSTPTWSPARRSSSSSSSAATTCPSSA